MRECGTFPFLFVFKIYLSNSFFRPNKKRNVEMLKSMINIIPFICIRVFNQCNSFTHIVQKKTNNNKKKTSMFCVYFIRISSINSVGMRVCVGFVFSLYSDWPVCAYIIIICHIIQTCLSMHHSYVECFDQNK
jgi:hypothetical protein